MARTGATTKTYATIAAIVAVIAIAAVSLSENKPSKRNAGVAYHYSQWNEYAENVETAIRDQSKASAEAKLQLSHVYGGVVSHHIPTTIPRLVEFYSKLKDAGRVKNFIIIGPDHTDAGNTPATVSAIGFATKFGSLEPIPAFAHSLEKLSFVSIDEKPFDPEHAIGSQTLLISKFFPEARVTPLILRSDITLAQAEALGEAIAPYLSDETVLIASVDFSHYLPTSQALVQDELSGQIIKNLDERSVRTIGADSDRSISVFVRAMKLKNARDTEDFEVLNTNDFMQNDDYTTGYVFGYWGIR